jgi:hypothetical protein
VRFDWRQADGSAEGWVVYEVDGGRARVEAWLLRPGERALAVVETGAPAPPPGRDLRYEGLWLSVVEEGPGHWSVGLEAMGLLLDDPADERGEPCPLGLDLGWDEGRVDGEVLAGPHVVIRVDGTGEVHPS